MKSRLRTTASMSNTGYHQNGKPTWWAYTRENGQNIFIDVEYTRGDKELDCIVDVPAGTTVHCGAGKGTYKTVRQTVVTKALPEEKEIEKVEEKIDMNKTERLEASVKSAEQAVEYAIANNMAHVEADKILADRTERLAAEKMIDADKLQKFPTTRHGKPHYVTIPQPKPVMTDEERDSYVAENVKYPDNFYIESVYCIRESAESQDFKIRIGFAMKPEAK